MLVKTTRPKEVTEKMVCAAERLLTALAMEKYLEVVVTGYQQAVLKRLGFVAAPEHQESFGAQPILSPKHSYLLSESDWKTYVTETSKARSEAKLVVPSHDDCPLALAIAERVQAENNLLSAMSDMPQLQGYELTAKSTAELRSRAVSMALQFLEPYTRTNEEIIADLIKAGRMV